jgi:hypothetical protein
MNPHLAATILVVGAVSAAGGGPSESAVARGVAQDSLGARLETGCAGGVTGGGGGVIVTESGRFYRWGQPGPESSERTLTLVRRDSARAAALFRAAEQRGLTHVKFSEPFNVTCALALVRGGQRHEIAWPFGQAPRPIRKLVELSKEIEAAARPR